MTDLASPSDTNAEATQDGAAVEGPHPAEEQPLTLRAMQGVELDVDVVIGRARMTLARLLGIRPRSTFSLNRALHSPAEVMVNGTLFARGELVAVNDAELGVQITEIVNGDLPERSV